MAIAQKLGEFVKKLKLGPSILLNARKEKNKVLYCEIPLEQERKRKFFDVEVTV